MASKTVHTSLVIRGYCFSALISHESWYFKCGNLVVVRCNSCGREDGRVFCCESTKAVFFLQKLGKKNQSCCKGALLSQLPTKPNGRLKFFTNDR